MSRLIDADALAEIYADRMCKVSERYGLDSSEAGILSGAYKLLESMPTITTEPVVRCKDCIYSKMTTDGSCKYCQYLTNEFDVIDAVYFDGNDFCSHGKWKGADDVD